MTEKEFLDVMDEILDTEESVSMDTVLEDLEEWDSLSIVSFLAMVDVEYGKTMRAAQFKDAQTIGDLYRLVMG